MPDNYLDELAEDIELIPDRREILELMVALGKELDELPPEERGEHTLVPGCVSNVHIKAELDGDGRVQFRGSSDAFIVKGYVHALLEQFDGWTPEQFLRDAEAIVEQFLARTDLAKSIIPTRANSIGNILMMMMKKVVEQLEEA